MPSQNVELSCGNSLTLKAIQHTLPCTAENVLVMAEAASIKVMLIDFDLCRALPPSPCGHAPMHHLAKAVSDAWDLDPGPGTSSLPTDTGQCYFF